MERDRKMETETEKEKQRERGAVLRSEEEDFTSLGSGTWASQPEPMRYVFGSLKMAFRRSLEAPGKLPTVLCCPGRLMTLSGPLVNTLYRQWGLELQQEPGAPRRGCGVRRAVARGKGFM